MPLLNKLFGKTFANLFVTVHTLSKGEVVGKASNERHAAIWVKNELVDKVSAWIKEEMESVARLKVPIEVHVGMGKNWDECK